MITENDKTRCIIASEDSCYLTWEKVIELGGAIVALLTPMIGLVIFIESKFVDIDKRLIHIETQLHCIVQAIATENSPAICTR